MKKLIALAITLAASAAYGQGTVNLSNNVGANIFTIKTADGGIVSGAGYSIGVYKAGTLELLGTGIVNATANGRFNAGTGAAVPGAAPGTTAQLIVRAWDNAGGTINSYAGATIKGESAVFTTGTLGGDPDGDGPLLPITPVGMVVAGANGFQSFSLTTNIPEPTTIALGAIGAAALLIRRRK